MVPIHETDLAEERWSKAGWENYELWEKVELRLKRKKRLWIFATLLTFIILSAVPIVMDRWSKWVALSLARHLAQEVNWLKREASTNHTAFRLKFITHGKLNYVIEKVQNCFAPQGEIVRAGSLVTRSIFEGYTWVNPEEGTQLGVPGLVNEFCYDDLAGSGAVLKGESVVGFGVMSVKDLAEKKVDHLSILLLSGPSAEISFD